MVIVVMYLIYMVELGMQNGTKISDLKPLHSDSKGAWSISLYALAGPPCNSGDIKSTGFNSYVQYSFFTKPYTSASAFFKVVSCHFMICSDVGTK